MASKTRASVTLFLSLNLLFFAIVSGTDCGSCHNNPPSTGNGGNTGGSGNGGSSDSGGGSGNWQWTKQVPERCSEVGCMCKFSWWIGGSGNWESSNDAMLQLDRGAGGFRGGSLLVHSHKSKCAGNKSECATLP
ncbi:lipid transfer protein earli 1 [Nicotiana attenuata]|uniref:Lipid transfer protein earli 1 n=1 Tax=Nicotiana attenuata TaxID=49451 RepID=A0A1J6IRF7_NICAT|nr:lipid transfer protein earli 1 [Nicotiana attenuata]